MKIFGSAIERLKRVPGVRFTGIVAEEYGNALKGWTENLPDKAIDRSLQFFIHTLLLVYSHTGDNKSE